MARNAPGGLRLGGKGHELQAIGIHRHAAVEPKSLEIEAGIGGGAPAITASPSLMSSAAFPPSAEPPAERLHAVVEKLLSLGGKAVSLALHAPPLPQRLGAGGAARS